MYINKNLIRKEIEKIYATTSSDFDAAIKVLNLWQDAIKTGYNDGVHTLDFFEKILDKTGEDIKNNTRGDRWIKPTQRILEDPSNINTILNEIVNGATLSAYSTTTGRCLLDHLIETDDLTTASLIFALQQAGTARFPTDDLPTEHNTLRVAMKANPIYMRMMLVFEEVACQKPVNFQTMARELNNIKKSATNSQELINLKENTKRYNEFIKERGMTPVFAKEDAFAKQQAESIVKQNSNITNDIVKTIKQNKENSNKTTNQKLVIGNPEDTQIRVK